MGAVRVRPIISFFFNRQSALMDVDRDKVICNTPDEFSASIEALRLFDGECNVQG
jgi:hypothetical protein